MWEVYLPYKKSSTYICQPNQLTLFSCTEIKFNVQFIGTQILRQKGILTRQSLVKGSYRCPLGTCFQSKKDKKTKEMEIRSIKVMQLMCYDGQGPAWCGWVGGVIEDTCKIV